MTQLAAPLFEQIVSAFDAPIPPAGATGATGTQRRREPRVGISARVTLIPLTGDDTLAPGPITVPLRNLSAGGIGFLHGDKVRLDEQFVVLLPHGGTRDSVAVLCQVAYYQPLADRLFAVGARFVRVLKQPAALDAGLSLPARPDAGMRRVAS